MNLKDDLRKYNFTQEELEEYLECDAYISLKPIDKLYLWIEKDGEWELDSSTTLPLTFKNWQWDLNREPEIENDVMTKYLLEQMRPYQVMYEVCMKQLEKLLAEDRGKIRI